MYIYMMVAVTEQSDRVTMEVVAETFSDAVKMLETNCINCGDYLLAITSIDRMQLVR
jgi:hypothetical protein